MRSIAGTFTFMWLKHWHGASATTALTHLAIQETTGGTNVQWMEHVTDEQYGK